MVLDLVAGAAMGAISGALDKGSDKKVEKDGNEAKATVAATLGMNGVPKDKITEVLNQMDGNPAKSSGGGGGSGIGKLAGNVLSIFG